MPYNNYTQSIGGKERLGFETTTSGLGGAVCGKGGKRGDAHTGTQTRGIGVVQKLVGGKKKTIAGWSNGPFVV